MLSNLQAALQLIVGLAADTSFVLASKPPHTAEPSEIEKDDQPIIDRSISSVHLFSSVFVYGLAAAQLGSDWVNSGCVVGHKWNGFEWVGVGAMVFGGSLRLWCYRTLGQFFTFNVGPSLLNVVRADEIQLAIRKVSTQFTPYSPHPFHVPKLKNRTTD
jgi:hypothetical protein